MKSGFVGQRSEERSDSMVEFYQSSDVVNTRKMNSPAEHVQESSHQSNLLDKNQDYSVSASLMQPPKVVGNDDPPIPQDERSRSPFRGPSNLDRSPQAPGSPTGGEQKVSASVLRK